MDAAVSGSVYKISDEIIVPETEIVAAVAPQIVSASELLIERLRREPESIYDMPPRQFEEMLAELFDDLGYEVELTKATRDGGKDILAYKDTDFGRFLCLIEAKRYKQEHKIGVDLVRGLYGTLCDHRATSAMLVTSSSFSPDAREFQQRHEFELSLKDYTDVVAWVRRYKQNDRRAG